MMESAIGILVSSFQSYAGSEGSSSTLSRDEFHRLVSCELPNLVENTGDAAAIDQLMKCLDKNNDGELNFLEFWQLIGQLADKHSRSKQ